MNTLEKWNPFREMNELQRSLSSLLENGTWHLRPLPSETHTGTPKSTAWTPLVDITEDDSEYLIKVELPAVRKEDLKIRVEDGVLTIEGERHFEKDEKSTRVHRIERSYGTFARSFTLPEDGDATRVKAEFKNGLLEVHVGKDEKAKPKSIEVKIG